MNPGLSSLYVLCLVQIPTEEILDFIAETWLERFVKLGTDQIDE